MDKMKYPTWKTALLNLNPTEIPNICTTPQELKYPIPILKMWNLKQKLKYLNHAKLKKSDLNPKWLEVLNRERGVGTKIPNSDFFLRYRIT